MRDKILEKWIYPVVEFKDLFITHEDRVRRMVEVDEMDRWLENKISNEGLIK